jgi:hypothetical protein
MQICMLCSYRHKMAPHILGLAGKERKEAEADLLSKLISTQHMGLMLEFPKYAGVVKKRVVGIILPHVCYAPRTLYPIHEYVSKHSCSSF